MTRLGYSVSEGIYAPDTTVTGVTITISSGSATVYAGLPDADSHHVITSLSAGQSYMVDGLAEGEVVSVQSADAFSFELSTVEAPPAEADAGASSDDAAAQGDEVLVSGLVTWTCTGSPCPWGDQLTGQAAVWPASTQPSAQRLGYTVSEGIYLPAAAANDLTITVLSGTASVYAGALDAASHRWLGSIGTGASFTISGLGTDEVASLQSDAQFTYTTVAGTSGESDAGTADAGDVGGDAGDVGGDAGEGAGIGQSADSQQVTWNCTGSECPWGSSLSGQALVWPTSLNPVAARLGYTVSAGIYLPAESSEGLAVTLLSGNASAYAGAPDASSHRLLGALTVGQPFNLGGLGTGEVVSVQGDSTFSYVITTVEPSSDDAGTSADAGTGTDAGSGSDAGTTDPSQAQGSSLVTWSCTGSPCPWGDSLDGHAAAWSASLQPSNARLGYTVSAGIYLPATVADGATITVLSGSASVYAGAPDASSHAVLSSLGAGESYTVWSRPTTDVVSLQGNAEFTFTLSFDPVDADGGAGPGPVPGTAMSGQSARWRCNTPGCSDPDWEGAVVAWPSWAAYQSNGRTGTNSRAVYTPSGEPLYPYMGGWANGCKVTVTNGRALIIEWERGTDEWRETLLHEGESHVINLVSPEDGAMIESNNLDEPFSVAVENCEPQPL